MREGKAREKNRPKSEICLFRERERFDLRRIQRGPGIERPRYKKVHV